MTAARRAQHTARPNCRDCGLDVSAAGQWYMVKDTVWAASGLGPTDGVLCLADLERRLGRPLRYDDFRPTDGENRKYWGGHDRMLPDIWTQHADQAAFELWCRTTSASLDDVKDSIKATAGDDNANAHMGIHPDIALPVLEHPGLPPSDKLRIICAMQRLGFTALAAAYMQQARGRHKSRHRRSGLQRNFL